MNNAMMILELNTSWNHYWLYLGFHAPPSWQSYRGCGKPRRRCLNLDICKIMSEVLRKSIANCQFTHKTWQWPHCKCGGVSNHQPHDCLVNHLFGRLSKKTLKLRVTDLFARNSPVTGEFPHKGPVTRKMFPFNDVIMIILTNSSHLSTFSLKSKKNVDRF